MLSHPAVFGELTKEVIYLRVTVSVVLELFNTCSFFFCTRYLSLQFTVIITVFW